VADKEIFNYALGQKNIDDMKFWEKSKDVEGALSFKNKYMYRGWVDDALRKTIQGYKDNPDRDGVVFKDAVGMSIDKDYFDPFAQFTSYLGEDDKGTYMEMRDTWDLNNEFANNLLIHRPKLNNRIYYKVNKYQDDNYYAEEAKKYNKDPENLKNEIDELRANDEFIIESVPREQREYINRGFKAPQPRRSTKVLLNYIAPGKYLND